jgi:hypothetical protein
MGFITLWAVFVDDFDTLDTAATSSALWYYLTRTVGGEKYA